MHTPPYTLRAGRSGTGKNGFTHNRPYITFIVEGKVYMCCIETGAPMRRQLSADPAYGLTTRLWPSGWLQSVGRLGCPTCCHWPSLYNHGARWCRLKWYKWLQPNQMIDRGRETNTTTAATKRGYCCNDDIRRKSNNKYNGDDETNIIIQEDQRKLKAACQNKMPQHVGMQSRDICKTPFTPILQLLPVIPVGVALKSPIWTSASWLVKAKTGAVERQPRQRKRRKDRARFSLMF